MGSLCGAQRLWKDIKDVQRSTQIRRKLIAEYKSKSWFNAIFQAKDGGTKVRSSELMCFMYEIHYWQKSYPRGNGVILGTSSYLTGGLLLRCWLCLSWLCKSSQGLRGSLIKKHHELSSDRRETGRFLSMRCVCAWRKAEHSTGGRSRRYHWC